MDMNRSAGNVGYFALMFDLSRGKQALLSITQPALGAMFALGGLPDARTLVLGILAAAAGYFAVFSLNDVLDYRVDRESIKAGKTEGAEPDLDVTFLRHPLARGDISFSIAIIWVVALALISATLAYLLNSLCLVLFISCVCLEILYCAMRSVSWSKTFISGAMVGVGGLAGWAAVAPLTFHAFYYLLFLASWEIAGRNLPNDLADIDSDRSVGIKTVATVFGNRSSALATLAGAIVTIILVIALPAPATIRLATVVIGAWSMGLPAVILARSPSSAQAAAYFNRASLFPALAFGGLLLFMFVGGLV